MKKQQQERMSPPEHAGGNRAFRPRDAGRTRKAILRAARELFAHASYENVQTRQIAALAGVDAALLNRYFGSKKRLFAAVLDDIGTEQQPFPQSGMLAALGERMSCAFRGNASHIGIEALNIAIFSASSPEVAPMIKERFRDAMREIAARLGDGSDASPACVFLACTMGAIITRRLLPEDAMPELSPDMLQEHFRLLLESLRASARTDYSSTS